MSIFVWKLKENWGNCFILILRTFFEAAMLACYTNRARSFPKSSISFPETFKSRNWLPRYINSLSSYALLFKVLRFKTVALILLFKFLKSEAIHARHINLNVIIVKIIFLWFQIFSFIPRCVHSANFLDRQNITIIDTSLKHIKIQLFLVHYHLHLFRNFRIWLKIQ